MRKISLLFILLFLFSCKERFNNIEISSINYRLGLRADSIDDSSKKNIYYTSFPLCFIGNSFKFKGKMFVKDSIFYFRIIDKRYVTKFFPLFDLRKTKQYIINIKQVNKKDTNIQKKIFVTPQKSIIKNNCKIFIFKVRGILCSDNKNFDAVYFVDYKKGVIGSYLYKSIDGIDYYAYPEGDILRDKIDYSKFYKFQLL